MIAMSWVVWRQYRAAAAITAALVAAFAALIVGIVRQGTAAPGAGLLLW